MSSYKPEVEDPQWGVFPSTHWSVVVAAAQPGDASANRALAELYQAYWYPLYAYARRCGHGPLDAEDLTQGFFAYVMERGLVGRADAKRGRFRSFLLSTFRNYRHSEADKAQAQKRGGGCPHYSLNTQHAETRFAAELSTSRTPEHTYDRLWALTVLDQALQRLEAEDGEAGRTAYYARLYPLLQGEQPEHTYAELAAGLGTTAGALKAAVCRMRQRYREWVRWVVLQTVELPTEVDGELEDLMSALRG